VLSLDPPSSPPPPLSDVCSVSGFDSLIMGASSAAKTVMLIMLRAMPIATSL
jgi:hypothetical protein